MDGDRSWLRYSQREGFTEFELDSDVPDAGGGCLSEWLKTLGYTRDECDGEETHEFETWTASSDSKVGRIYRRFAWICHKTCDGVFVKDNADLLALRLLAAPFVLLGLVDELKQRHEEEEVRASLDRAAKF